MRGGGLARLRRACLLAAIISCIANIAGACLSVVAEALYRHHRLVVGEPPCPPDCRRCYMSAARRELRAVACTQGGATVVAVRRTLIIDVMSVLPEGAKPDEKEVDEAVDALAKAGAVKKHEDCGSVLPAELCGLLAARRSHVYVLTLDPPKLRDIARACGCCLELAEMLRP